MDVGIFVWKTRTLTLEIKNHGVYDFKSKSSIWDQVTQNYLTTLP